MLSFSFLSHVSLFVSFLACVFFKKWPKIDLLALFFSLENSRAFSTTKPLSNDQ